MIATICWDQCVCQRVGEYRPGESEVLEDKKQDHPEGPEGLLAVF